MATGRPVEVPGARYETTKAYITPNAWGGHSWHAMAYNPQTKLVYIPTIHYAAAYSDSGMDIRNWKSVAFFGGTGVNLLWAGKEPREYPASLQAWDPVKQKAVWSIPQQTPMNAGVLTTAGNLVLQGRSDGKLLAYNARTGDSLWAFNAGLGISAPPITYKVNGKQYIALLVGWGGIFSGVGNDLGWSYGAHRRRLISFSLDGKADMPALPPPSFANPIIDPGFVVNENLAATGEAIFGLCSWCHGGGAMAKGMAPDLRASSVPLKLESFAEVVRAGTRAKKAMPMFPDMTDDQLTAIMHYIRKRANDSKPVEKIGVH
jgi:quinohemoprotein ethanol dehydrogenase